MLVDGVVHTNVENMVQRECKSVASVACELRECKSVASVTCEFFRTRGPRSQCVKVGQRVEESEWESRELKRMSGTVLKRGLKRVGGTVYKRELKRMSGTV